MVLWKISAGVPYLKDSTVRELRFWKGVVSPGGIQLQRTVVINEVLILIASLSVLKCSNRRRAV